MISDNLLNDLEDIVNEGLKDSSIPYAKGNSIRIKQYVVRQSKVGFLVYDSSTNKQVHRSQIQTLFMIEIEIAIGMHLHSPFSLQLST